MEDHIPSHLTLTAGPEMPSQRLFGAPGERRFKTPAFSASTAFPMTHAPALMWAFPGSKSEEIISRLNLPTLATGLALLGLLCSALHGANNLLPLP